MLECTKRYSELELWKSKWAVIHVVLCYWRNGKTSPCVFPSIRLILIILLRCQRAFHPLQCVIFLPRQGGTNVRSFYITRYAVVIIRCRHNKSPAPPVEIRSKSPPVDGDATTTTTRCPGRIRRREKRSSIIRNRVRRAPAVSGRVRRNDHGVQ